LGRAILILQSDDPVVYHEAIVKACLHNQAYDPQLEGTRVEYLLDLIRLSGDSAYFRRRILDALQTADPDDYYDLEQLFDLAQSFAREGDEVARMGMYGSFARKATDPSLGTSDLELGADEIIELDGVAGFLFVAERFGERVLADQEFWANDYLLGLVEKQCGADAVQSEVERARGENPAINAYMEAVEATMRRRAETNPSRVDWAVLSYDELKRFIGQAGRRMPIMGLSRWGRAADAPSLELAARDLLREDDPRRLLDYVRIFSDRAFPLDPRPLVRLAWGDDEQLAWAAGLALGNIRHPLVRQTALGFLDDANKRDQSVSLLVANYEPGDHVLIEQALQSPQDTEDEIVSYHHLGYDALEFFEENPAPEFAASLVTLYERGPCSHCRDRCFDLLNALNLLPTWIIEECRYDANPDLRTKASSMADSREESM
jgi:hypothetical protein